MSLGSREALRIAVLGATGRMGRLVVQAALEQELPLVAAVTHGGSPSLGVDAGVVASGQPCGVAITAVGPGCFADADVIVDFSLPEALAAALPHLGERALVTGTTGLDADVLERLRAQSSRAPVLIAANFSTGVNLLLHLVTEAAAALPDYDVEIVEIHHRLKQDAPSGTALALGRAAAHARGAELDEVARHGRQGRTGVRTAAEIGLHAVRGGDVVGEHTVWLAGPGERVQLGHVASSRQTFAAGALRAARWVHGRAPGAYEMTDVLGLSR